MTFFYMEPSDEITSKKISEFIDDEQGATAVEYGLFVALIAAVIVTLVSSLGTKIKTAFNTIVNALP
jgi:pilus assembly protein Flp/PilA